MQGSGLFYKGKYFLDEDVVFVSMQYRVGALGKFSQLLKTRMHDDNANL